MSQWALFPPLSHKLISRNFQPDELRIEKYIHIPHALTPPFKKGVLIIFKKKSYWVYLFTFALLNEFLNVPFVDYKWKQMKISFNNYVC